jgi:hypothetical protein
MTSAEPGPLVLLGEIDDLVERLDRWSNRPVPWGPARRGQFAVKRLVEQLTRVRVRLTAPLVVATFGGTGTGKSSLVNALVGEDVSPSGRERPTTRRPLLFVPPSADVAQFGLPLDEVEVVRSSAPLLRDIALLDLPDPDTAEGCGDGADADHFGDAVAVSESARSNTSRLRRLLPFCDVLLCTSTQQKYRSARVGDEMLRGADGCRLLFVQTHADLDVDIRDDWRSRLPATVAVEDLFFVDSRRALESRVSGTPADGEFGRLEQVLTTQLAATERVRVRWANVGDLTASALAEIDALLAAAAPRVDRLREVLESQRREATARIVARIDEELSQSRGLWERRLLSAAIDQWGLTPLVALLRMANGLGGWLASLAMFRARTTAQVAIIGVSEGLRRMSRARHDAQDDQRLASLAADGLGVVSDHAARLIAEGYAREAELEPTPSAAAGGDASPPRDGQLAELLLVEARAAVDRLVEQTAADGARLARYGAELVLALFLAQVAWKPAKNFFYEHPWLDRPLLSSDYYIHAAVFATLLGGLLVTWVSRSLRAALARRLPAVLAGLAEQSALASDSGAPPLYRACIEVRDFRDELSTLRHRASDLRARLQGEPLGSSLPPRATRDAVSTPRPASSRKS